MGHQGKRGGQEDKEGLRGGVAQDLEDYGHYIREPTKYEKTHGRLNFINT